MAPELFEKKNVYDPTKVDAWALGVLLFYLYEGSYPFKGYSEKELTRNILACNYTFTKCHGWPLRAIEGALLIDPVKRFSVS
jgi:serine/threonine protein kinase